MNKERLFVVGFWPDYEAFFFNSVKSDRLEIEIINPLKIAKERYHIPFRTPRILRNIIYKKIIKFIAKKNKDSLILFQDHKLILDTLLEIDIKPRFCVFMRNILEEKSKTGKSIINLINKTNINVFSFDDNDCRKHSFKKYNQYIEKIIDIEEREFDLCFVGRNKGREKIIKQITDIANQCNLSHNIVFIDSDKKHSISYLDYLKMQLNTKCIIDITQENQVGLTLRPLEAAINGRKLLTNNKNVLAHAIFDNNDVLIFDSSTTDKDVFAKQLRDFIASPVSNKNYISPYLTTQVIEKIHFDSQVT